MELLRKLCECSAPSGREDAIRTMIANEIKPYVDEISVDTLGNLIAHKKGNGAKVMFAAHMDEIGVMVTFIDEKGFLRFAPVGGVDPYACVFRGVDFPNGVHGVVSYEEEAENIKKLKFNQLFIDIGANCKEEAETLISIGTMGVFEGTFHRQGNVVTTKALDNRAGCYVLIEALKALGESANDVYAVFTAQEEVGLRGARVAANKIMPEFAFAIDVTDTGDTPKAPVMAVKLGAGPAIKVKDNSILTHIEAREIMFDCAKKAEVPYQLEILEYGGTDAGAIHLSGLGVKTGAISIPTRYIHSQTETASVSDIQKSITLTAELMKYQYEK